MRHLFSTSIISLFFLTTGIAQSESMLGLRLSYGFDNVQPEPYFPDADETFAHLRFRTYGFAFFANLPLNKKRNWSVDLSGGLRTFDAKGLYKDDIQLQTLSENAYYAYCNTTLRYALLTTSISPYIGVGIHTDLALQVPTAFTDAVKSNTPAELDIVENNYFQTPIVPLVEVGVDIPTSQKYQFSLAATTYPTLDVFGSNYWLFHVVLGIGFK